MSEIDDLFPEWMKTTTNYSNLGEGLTQENVEKAWDKFLKDCERPNIMGIEIRTSKIVPSNEIWIVNPDGKTLKQIIRFAEEKEE